VARRGYGKVPAKDRHIAAVAQLGGELMVNVGSAGYLRAPDYFAARAASLALFFGVGLLLVGAGRQQAALAGPGRY
jgi:multisubunit Na+/H+ antiporter MnhG subunit